MTYDVAADIRLDPRLKAILASIPVEPAGDVESREALLAEANSEAARQQAELIPPASSSRARAAAAT
jgi:hypothetical protein